MVAGTAKEAEPPKQKAAKNMGIYLSFGNWTYNVLLMLFNVFVFDVLMMLEDDQCRAMINYRKKKNMKVTCFPI